MSQQIISWQGDDYDLDFDMTVGELNYCRKYYGGLEDWDKFTAVVAHLFIAVRRVNMNVTYAKFADSVTVKQLLDAIDLWPDEKEEAPEEETPEMADPKGQDLPESQRPKL